MGLAADKDLPMQAANFAANAYSGKPMKPEKLNGWNFVTDTSNDNGFHAKAYVKDDVVMIAYRGSDDIGDTKVDHQMLRDKLPDELVNAEAFYTQMQAQFPDKKIVVTGHSLGGSLSQMVASNHEEALAITFDAVGTKSVVNANGLHDYNNSANYIINGDLISNSSEHVGFTTVMPNQTGRDGLPNSPHAIGNFTQKKIWEQVPQK